MRKRLDVKPASTNNDRRFSVRMDLIDGVRRGAGKFFRVHVVVKRRCANQMMRSFRERCGIGLRGQKIEAAINLKRIGADNFGLHFTRNVGRDFGFTAGGGADDEECARHRPNNGTLIERRYRKQIGRRAPDCATSPD
jgi:hypothetical protein